MLFSAGTELADALLTTGTPAGGAAAAALSFSGRVTSDKLQVTRYKVQVTSDKLQVTSYKLRGRRRGAQLQRARAVGAGVLGY